MVERLGLKQPPGGIARSLEQASKLIERLQFPVIVRPSYVLGGSAMEIIYNHKDLKEYMTHRLKVSDEFPVLIDHFLIDAIEIDVDAICDGSQVLVAGVMQHIEQAGIHSGDSACSLPVYSLSSETVEQIKQQTTQLAHALNVCGIMNIQFAVKDGEIYIIEVNPRASRTVPFVSKAIGLPLAKIAAHCVVGRSLAQQSCAAIAGLSHFSVKEAAFPFAKFAGADPLLGPEMRSTGEVMGIGMSFGEAYAKSQIAAGNQLPSDGQVSISVRDSDKANVVEVAQRFLQAGFRIVATEGTARYLQANQLECKMIHKVTSGKHPNIIDLINQSDIQLIINTTKGQRTVSDSYAIRRSAVQAKICYTTTIAGALAIVEGLSTRCDQVYKLQDLDNSATRTV